MRKILILTLTIFFVLLSGRNVFALTTAQQQTLDTDSVYYDPTQCGATGAGTVVAGTGLPSGASFPDLDPASMASAINTYISSVNPSSKLSGLGTTIVADAKNSNVNPFLIVAIAQKETSLASPTDYDVEYANNAFDREATSAQPNYPGAGPSANVLWYKWSSVEASIDYSAPENQGASGGGDFAAYLRDEYGSEIDSNDIVGLLEAYAPPGDNDTAEYITQVDSWVSQLISLTTNSGSSVTTTTPLTETTPTLSNDCGSVASVNCSTSTSSALSQTRQNVVCIAEQELAIWESQPGYPWKGANTYSETGYLIYSQNNVQLWCADFVSWVYDQAGYPLSPDPGWRNAGVAELQAIGQENQAFQWHPIGSGYVPSPGDIAIYGTQHANIVISVASGVITYIGGDQGGGGPGGGPFPDGSVVSANGTVESGSVVSEVTGGTPTGYVSPN